MRDRTLVILVIVIAVLNVGHTIDHVVRGDVPWPLTMDSLAFIVVSAIIYALIGGGLWLYWIGKIGPRSFMIAGAGGAAFGWLGHFSPYTDQPPQHIVNAHSSVAIGRLALAWLIALMLALIVASIYAGWLWLAQRRTSTQG